MYRYTNTHATTMQYRSCKLAIMWGRCSNHQGAVTYLWDKLYLWLNICWLGFVHRQLEDRLAWRLDIGRTMGVVWVPLWYGMCMCDKWCQSGGKQGNMGCLSGWDFLLVQTSSVYILVTWLLWIIVLLFTLSAPEQNSEWEYHWEYTWHIPYIVQLVSYGQTMSCYWRPEATLWHAM